MTSPCQIGFKCPYYLWDGDDGPICTHPYTPDNIPEDETFGFVDEQDCPLIEYPSPIHDILYMYWAFVELGSCPSQLDVEAEKYTKEMREKCEERGK